MQPTQSSMLWRTASGTSPRVTTSETAKRPPGRSTRKASRRTLSLSAERLMTQLEMMTSTELSGSGIFSISPLKNSAFSIPDFFWFSRARQHLIGHIEPVGFARGSDAFCRKQHVDAAARAEVENGFAGIEFRQRGG